MSCMVCVCLCVSVCDRDEAKEPAKKKREAWEKGFLLTRLTISSVSQKGIRCMPLLTVYMLLCIRGESVCEGVRAVFASLPSLPHSKLHSLWHSSATRITASRRLTFLLKVRQVPFKKKRDVSPQSTLRHLCHRLGHFFTTRHFLPAGLVCFHVKDWTTLYPQTNQQKCMHAWCNLFLATLLKRKKKKNDYNKRAHGQPQHTRNYEIKMMRMNGRMAQTSSSSLSFYPLLEKWIGGCNQRVCAPPKCSNCTKLLTERIYILSGKNCMGPYHTSLFAYDGDLHLQLEASQRLLWPGLA